MNRDDLDSDLVIAQALKISLLRLVAVRSGRRVDLHPKDEAFGEEALVLALARLNTKFSRKALVDLMDFQLDDAVWDAFGEILGGYADALRPEIKARIGAARCPEAQRKDTYLPVVPKKNRDRQLDNILFEMKPEIRALIDASFSKKKRSRRSAVKKAKSA